MAWFIVQSAVMIVLAFLLGLLVGWIIWHRRGAAASGTAPADAALSNDVSAAAGNGAAAEPRDAVTTSRATTKAPRATTAAPPDTTTVSPDVATAPSLIASSMNGSGPAHDEPPASDGSPDAEPAPALTESIPQPRPATAKPATAPKAAKATKAKAPAKVAAVTVVPTPVHDEPEPEPIDDLAWIEGIGPKIAGALVDAGIRTYDQLADADVDTLRAAINTAGIKFAPSITTWSRQAALLAMGDEAGFEALVAHLIAGREPGAATAETADEPAAELAPIENLARVEGIGPKIAGALVGAGIRSYRQLADADADTLRTAINTAGIKFAPSITTWSQQAQLLADGDEAGFQALTDRLIAGRDESSAERTDNDEVQA